jgi:hypothetical protein
MRCLTNCLALLGMTIPGTLALGGDTVVLHAGEYEVDSRLELPHVEDMGFSKVANICVRQGDGGTHGLVVLSEVECMAIAGWWFHLRIRCAECGHIGCCDSSPNQHASKHALAPGHPIITSFEPGQRWFYDYRRGEFFAGPKLAAPQSHPLDQTVPGPAGQVPSDSQKLLHE